MQPTTQASGALRARLHGMWAAVAPAWGEHADYADSRGAAITARMLERSAPRPGERVLELACGAGVAAAELVGPAGEVVLSDVATEMTGGPGPRRSPGRWPTGWPCSPSRPGTSCVPASPRRSAPTRRRPGSTSPA